MGKEKIIDYVLNTPNNTNPRILGQMLDEYAAEGGGSTNGLIVEISDNGKFNKTWQEICDQIATGGNVAVHYGNTYTTGVSVGRVKMGYEVYIFNLDVTYGTNDPNGYPSGGDTPT